MVKVIAICNQKGGTGKTTTAINVASYLALFGKNVLVVDLDPQANATSGLGIDRHTIKKSTYHVLLEEASLADVTIKTSIEHLFLAPSNLDLTGAEVELVGAMGREYRLKKAANAARQTYDLVFIDAPPSLGLLTINALCAADSVLIPVQCEYYALEGLSQLMNTVTLVRNNINPALSVEGVVLTMADFRTNLSREVIREVKENFKEKVYDTVIPRSIRLSEAPSYGKPIALYDRNNLGAVKYEELAREIIGMPQAVLPTQSAPEQDSVPVKPASPA